MILSVCSLLLGVVFAVMTYRPDLFDAERQPFAVRFVEVISLLPALLGGLPMFLAMEWYCLELDTARKPIRLLQALMMLLTLPLGQIVYYFLVYRPQTERVEMKLM